MSDVAGMEHGHSLPQATAVHPLGGGRYAADVPLDWTQGRTAFGGLAAGIGLRAVLEHVGVDRPARSVDTTFVGPLPPGPVEVAVEVLRQGRHATIVGADLRRGEDICTRLVVVLGSARESAIRVAEPPPAPTMPREQGTLMPYIEGLTPAFTKHFELWWTEGAFPYAGNPQGALGGYARLREPGSGPVDAAVAHLALMDAWPVPVLAAATGPTPSSSVRWSAHLVPQPAPLEWVWFDYRTDFAADGYASVWGRMYAAERLVGWTEQLAVIFDKPAADRSGG